MPIEAGKETQIETVPKAELEKVQNESKQALNAAKQEVEAAKNQLLSQEYLEFLEAKKTPVPKGKQQETGSEEVKQLKAQLSEMRSMQAEIAATVELDQVIKAHADFETYRKDVQKILESSKTDITIEQAYFMARGQKPDQTPEEKAAAEKVAVAKKPDFSTEKPGGVYPPTKETEKKFKSETEAGLDAAAQVLARHNISGGVI